MTAWYRLGTIALTNGSASVTGTGTAWTTSVRAGDFLLTSGQVLEVSAVGSSTALTLAQPWTGSTATGVSYAVAQGIAWGDVTRLSYEISQLVNSQTDILSGSGAPSNTLGSDGSVYFRIDVPEYYAKAAGVWGSPISLVGPPGPAGPGFTVTSLTTNTVGTGAKTFTIASGGASYLGARLRVASVTTPATYMEGVVTAATDTTVTVTVDRTAGSGTLANWRLVLAGDPGTQGAAGPGVTGTSLTTLPIGTGTKTLTTQSGIGWVAGQRVVIASTVNPANYMEGRITSYSGSTLAVSVDAIGGAGTLANWNIGLIGVQGPAGAQGLQGDPGPTGAAGASYPGTSTTSVAIGSGSKTFTTQAGLAYVVGSRVRAASLADPTSHWMEGIVTAYASTSLTITVASDDFAGSGSRADWSLSLTGEPGRDGADGTTIQSVGVYNAGTTYSLYDTAVSEGSTWIYINTTPSAGNAPPTLPTQSNTHWHIFARAGNDGAPGATYATRAAIGSVDLTGVDLVTIERWDASSVIAPAIYVRTATEPSHAGKAQDVNGDWFELAETEVSPAMCGSPEDYTANASAAVQRAFDIVRASYDSDSQTFRRQVVGGGRGYKIATSINLTNVRQAGFTARELHFYGTCTGKPVLDLSGTQGTRLEISFYGDEVSSPRCAILISRADYLGSFGGAGLHDLRECDITGHWNGAGIINYGGEVVRYPNRVWNWYKSATRAAILITGNSAYLAPWIGAGAGVDGSSLVSDYAVLPTGVVSCINHLFSTVDYRRPSSWGALEIASISKSTPGVVTLAAPTTKIVDGNGTYFTDAVGMTELNRTTAYLKRIDDSNYELYSNATLTTPLNTSTYGTFTSGHLWTATGPAVVLAAARGFTSAQGYILTYGSDAIVLDTRFGDVVDDLDWNIQHEAVPQRSVRVVTPTSGNVTLAKVSFSFLNAAQDWRDSIIGAQPLGGTATINGLRLDVRAWGSPPGIGVVAPSSLTLKSCNIRVPDGAYFDPNDFATRATGTVTDYTTSITQEYYPGLAWTPALTFGGASAGMVYTQQDGWYEVHGEMIVAHFVIAISNKGTSTGAARVSLPVGVHASQSGHGALHRPTGMASLTSPVTIEVPAGVNNGNFYHHGATGATLLTDTNVSSTATIRGWMTYRRAV